MGLGRFSIGGTVPKCSSWWYDRFTKPLYWIQVFAPEPIVLNGVYYITLINVQNKRVSGVTTTLFVGFIAPSITGKGAHLVSKTLRRWSNMSSIRPWTERFKTVWEYRTAVIKSYFSMYPDPVCNHGKWRLSYTVVKVDGITPQRWLSRAHDKPRHGSCAIYFPGGISLGSFAKDVYRILVVFNSGWIKEYTESTTQLWFANV